MSVRHALGVVRLFHFKDVAFVGSGNNGLHISLPEIGEHTNQEFRVTKKIKTVYDALNNHWRHFREFSHNICVV